MKLKSFLSLILATVVLLGGAGCFHFGKSKKKKEDAAIAAGVETDFRRRWTDHRVAELTAQGTDATAARTQAEQEFREKYAYLKEEKK